MQRFVLLIALLVLLGCSRTTDNHNTLRIFLKEWSDAVTSGNEDAVRPRYAVGFVIPKVIFELPGQSKFTFDVAGAIIRTAGTADAFEVALPFSLVNDNGEADSGTVTLSVITQGNSFVIEDMSKELALSVLKHRQRLEAIANPGAMHAYDSLIAGIRNTAVLLHQHYDSVVFFSEVNSTGLFYVVKGNWEQPYGDENQRDKGDYKIGVVTGNNQVIVPVVYDKIYNPNGSFTGMIEVERNGQRGLFTLEGREFLPCEYDGIYPVDVPGILAQVKKGDRYGWVNPTGKVSLDPASHSNAKLFQSPLESESILKWRFRLSGDVAIMIDPYTDVDIVSGIIVYPSYLRDLNITPIAVRDMRFSTTKYDPEDLEMDVQIEKVESLSDKLYALVALFMEAGSDAREYHIDRNDLIVVDNKMNPVHSLAGLTKDNHNQDPCEGRPSYRSIAPTLYESTDGKGAYTYYKVTDRGVIENLETVRRFNFTKFVPISEDYLENRCRYESVDVDASGSSNANLVVIRGISNEDLDIMRNEIFAEYGYIFKSEKWKRYFEAKPWYKPTHSDVDALMNDIDKQNANFILEYQRNHKHLKEKRDSIAYGWAG